MDATWLVVHLGWGMDLYGIIIETGNGPVVMTRADIIAANGVAEVGPTFYNPSCQMVIPLPGAPYVPCMGDRQVRLVQHPQAYRWGSAIYVKTSLEYMDMLPPHSFYGTSSEYTGYAIALLLTVLYVVFSGDSRR